VTAFNEAVADMTPPPGEPFRLLQVVRDAPAGTLRVVLSVEPGAVRLELDPPDDDAQATVSLTYADAEALSRGELDPAQLLATGRVTVRGDLSVLVAGQAVLAAVGTRVAGLGGSGRPAVSST
jgi:hypothetical protein